MKRSGFTLVELLVVVAIIAVMTLVFPTLRLGVRCARQLQCVNNLRQLAAPVRAHAARHRDVLPPTRNPRTEWWQWAPWIGADGQRGNGEGPLASYAGGVDIMRRLVRCPALPLGVPPFGIGSNGRFDYATVEGWGGFRIANAPATAKLVHNGRTEILRTPLFLEEDPWFHSNRTHIDPVPREQGPSEHLA